MNNIPVYLLGLGCAFAYAQTNLYVLITELHVVMAAAVSNCAAGNPLSCAARYPIAYSGNVLVTGYLLLSWIVYFCAAGFMAYAAVAGVMYLRIRQARAYEDGGGL